MSGQISKKGTGAWVVHHAKKLDTVQTLSQYDSLRIAGKAGLLLSALSENRQASLTDKRVRQLSTAAGVDAVFELPVLLSRLEAQQLVSRGTGGMEILGLTSATVLQHTAEIFDACVPTPRELATVALAEYCSEQPRLASATGEQLGDVYQLSSREVKSLLRESVQVGFTDSEKLGDEELLFNGALFRRDELAKTQRVLASLSSEEERKVIELNELLSRQPCAPFEECEMVAGKQLLEKLLSIGMFELNEVSNPREVTVFVTRPSAYCKFGTDPSADTFDLAKALVAALSYGMSRSDVSRGRITMIDRLLEKLILGNWVGPATAIGEDYRILELKKVVQVRIQGYGFSMRLLKKEIGEIARAALTQGEASEFSLQLPGAAVTKYRGPEEQRVQVRERRTALEGSDIATILQSLRTGG
jgi:hypothetical protein